MCTKVSLCQSDTCCYSSDEDELEGYYDKSNHNGSGGRIIDSDNNIAIGSRDSIVSQEVLAAARLRARLGARSACNHNSVSADIVLMNTSNSGENERKENVQGQSNTNNVDGHSTNNDGEVSLSIDDGIIFDIDTVGIYGAGWVWSTLQDEVIKQKDKQKHEKYGKVESESDSDIDTSEEEDDDTDDDEVYSEDGEDDDDKVEDDIAKLNRHSLNDCIILDELVPVPATFWIMKTKHDLNDAADFWESVAGFSGKRGSIGDSSSALISDAGDASCDSGASDNGLDSDSFENVAKNKKNEEDLIKITYERHFKTEVTETFLRCVLEGFDERNVVQVKEK